MDTSNNNDNISDGANNAKTNFCVIWTLVCKI